MTVFELPWIPLSQNYQLFGYASSACAINSIRRGTFPVPAYKIGRVWVMDLEVVRTYFQDHRERGLAELRGESPGDD